MRFGQRPDRGGAVLDRLNVLDDKILGDPVTRRRRNARYWWAALTTAAAVVATAFGGASRVSALAVGMASFAGGYWFAHRDEARA
jgi:hypothetical protein